jgi:leucyl aminopeptidase
MFRYLFNAIDNAKAISDASIKAILWVFSIVLIVVFITLNVLCSVAKANVKANVKANTPQYTITHQILVRSLITQINPINIRTNLKILSAEPDRDVDSINGLDTALWLEHQLQLQVDTYKCKNCQIFTVPTGKHRQPSVILKISPTNQLVNQLELPAIVLGAHMDTLPYGDAGTYYIDNKPNKPGADDDGSGTVTVLEITRVLLNSQLNQQIKLNRPIYIIFYAGEEEGLWGSQYVVKYFQQHKIKVKAVMQLDMTGYMDKGIDNSFILIKNETNLKLNQYVTKLVHTYIGADRDTEYFNCNEPGGCSDDYTWTQNGIASTFPYESGDSHYIHGSKDTMSRLSLTYMTDFAKLGLAFVIELSTTNATENAQSLR